MKRWLLIGSVVFILGAAVAVAGAGAGLQRSDCPGKIVCPLTGEEVCRDRCPLVDADTSEATRACSGSCSK